MSRFFSRFCEAVAEAVGHQYAFFAAMLFVIIWLASGPIFGFSDTWQLVINTSTTIITFLIVFLIQNSQNRDSSAVEAKLDELIVALKEAHNQAVGLEHLSQQKIEAFRSKLEKLAKKN